MPSYGCVLGDSARDKVFNAKKREGIVMMLENMSWMQLFDRAFDEARASGATIRQAHDEAGRFANEVQAMQAKLWPDLNEDDYV
jgi:hypothetical protein